MDSALIAGAKYPLVLNHKVQVICFTALQKTSALPIHIGQILRIEKLASQH